MEDLIRKKDAMKPLLLAYREIQRQARESEKEGDAAVSYIFGALSGVFKDQICWAMEAPARGIDAGEILLDALEHYGERAQVDMISRGPAGIWSSYVVRSRSSTRGMGNA